AEEEEVARLQLSDFDIQVRRKAVDLRSVPLFLLLLQVIGIVGGGEIPPVGHRIESLSVKIRRDDLVAAVAERLDRLSKESAAKALRLVMGVNQKNAHGEPRPRTTRLRAGLRRQSDRSRAEFSLRRPILHERDEP